MTPEEPPSAPSSRPSIRIINRQRLAPSGRRRLAPILVRILADHGVPTGLSIDISLVRDPVIHPLNRTYRKIDQPTDVLAFPYIDPQEWSGERPLLRSDSPLTPAEEPLIGEILISTDQALKQSESLKKEIEEVIAHLAIHGVLHLLGYDHDRPETQREMRRMERRYLGLWNRPGEGDSK
ncbi:MAG: rRNA maturation RNase YbeY [Candidatus Eisenbacteria bacterium]|uniref:Endoribonuclease YbeY n=1 Tax=Eiseniibacteriota bacterium TaxID=2212470 RepID=A0A948RRL0_UNCEI|nr:rRNA maturation RNase YbeY [Candidatus Eisenbacteria bacterium]MBU1948046.1 rRNA maturation RNase YbeY [Candidatus Eisenbacteria bacterium]MBU2689705.1 rRNA maturation RNase YbeY [Candidatus Eisenbacteria bacterium]